MKKLEMEKMEVIEGGCPGIRCQAIEFGWGLGVWAVCTDICSGNLLYVEPW